MDPDSDPQHCLAGVDGGEQLAHVVLEVQQVDEGVVVEGQRFDYLVPYGVDVAEGLEVHVGELSHHCFDASFQGLFGQE